MVTIRKLLVSGPVSAPPAVFDDATLRGAEITGLQNGIYVFRWIISGGDGDCPNNQDDVSVLVANVVPTVASAGPDVEVCISTPVRMQANAPALNELGEWSVSPSAGVNFSNINDPQALVTGLSLDNTVYTFTWRVYNDCGQKTDVMTVTTGSSVGATQANAGPDQCLAGGTTNIQLAANAAGVDEVGTWTGTGITFTNPNAHNTTATVTGGDGNYTLTWTLTKGTCSPSADQVVISVSTPVSTASIIGGNQSLCGATTTAVTGSALSAGETGTWTQIEGPGGAIIGSPNAPATVLSGLSQGRFKFRWTVYKSDCNQSFADVTINISASPVTSIAGTNRSVCNVTEVQLGANAAGTGNMGTWSVLSGPNSPLFTSVATPGTPLSDPNAKVTNLIIGTYVLQWMIYSGPFCPPSISTIEIQVAQAATAGSAQNLCDVTTTSLIGNSGSNGTWTLQSTGHAITPVITSISGNTALVTNLGFDTFTFR
ncbi:MAG: hypothetical protein EOP51_30335, partial [Sphingobacteriales bacterium]